MPRKTKEQKELENIKNIEKVAKKTTRKTPKKDAIKNTIEKTHAKKTTSKEKAPSTKKTTTKKTVVSSAKTTKKGSTRKASTKKVSTKKSISTVKVEYYDLPYRYNQTVVKVLAQTPTNLFIYWDISDEDRENYKKQYGERFFEETKPVLIVHNKTLGYSFEIDINDFANSWYLHVDDAKCNYSIELGRRPIILSQQINTDYIYVSTSNNIEAPNDRVLFNKEQKMVYFRNIKTGEQSKKSIASSSFSFIRNMGRIYNIYDLYKEIYQEEYIKDLFNPSNPPFGNPSSGTFLSK